MNTALEINKAVADISKGVDKKSDAMMLMSPENNWEQYLIPAPYAIALLGELILISADTDFSLADKPPKDGFQLIRYPNSFRATLVQVCNSGWDAFNEAHTSMDQIRLHSGNVDTHIRNSVKFLMQGTPEEVKIMLPKSLQKVQDIADESLRLAENIEKKFIDVMQLIAEVLEASTSTKGTYEEKLKETKIAIEVAKTQKQASEDEKAESRRRLDMMDKQVQEAHDDYKKSMENMPSGLELLGLSLGDALVETVRGIGSIASGMAQSKVGGTQNTMETRECENNDTMDKKMSSHKICGYIPVLVTHVSVLAQIAKGGQRDKKGPSPDWDKITKGAAIAIKANVKNVLSNVTKETQSDLQPTVLKSCDKAIQICDELECLNSAMALDNKEQRIESMLSSIDALESEINRLNVKAKKTQGRNPIESKSPHISKMAAPTSSSSAQSAIEGARFKTEVAKETLKDAKDRQERAAEESRKSNEKLTKILVEMSKLDLQKIDFDTIRATLIKGIDALSKVREQWGKLVRFFQMLSNLIKCCLHTSLSSFVEQSNSARELVMAGLPIKVLRDTIYEEAFRAGQVAYVVHTISGAYVKISDKHLMDRITSLGRLIALDPKTDINEIKLKRKELHNGCADAQKAIQDIVRNEKKEFHAKIDARIAQIKALENKLPPIESERQAQIERDVKSAFTDEDLEDL